MIVNISYVPVSDLEIPDEIIDDFTEENNITWDGINPVLYPSEKVIETLKVLRNEYKNDAIVRSMVDNALAKLELVPYVGF